MVAVSLGAPEILVIVAVIALLFGAKKIPELARSLGRSQSEFKKGLREGSTEAPAESSGQTPSEPAESSD